MLVICIFLHRLCNAGHNFTVLVLFCPISSFNPFLHILVLTHLRKKLWENIVEKGEIAQNEQFHLFPQCFLCNLYLKIL